jgi:3'-phosphoadenosine 5'-phosphosulfate sulfotransferase (PAPS reductase)/FAD synthetase
VFSNTGCEHPETYEFINKCDKEYDLNLTWIEAVFHEGRKSTTHKIVSYETAGRSGEPYIEMVKKYGLPNISYPHCTRELKRRPLFSYRKQNGYGYFAIGIRSDEIDRLPSSGDDFENGLIYPLITHGATKIEVNRFWERNAFTLNIPEHSGNCVFCFKKSDKKLFLAHQTNPEFFEIAKKLEKITTKKLDNKLFRKHRTTSELIATFDISDDSISGCSDHCEAM